MIRDRFRQQVKAHFDAAHHIRDYQGKCNRPHGHRWEVEVVIEGSKLDERNILVDFGEVKKVLNVVLHDLDHYYLNEVLDEPNVTAEYLAREVYLRFNHIMASVFEAHELTLHRVNVWESPECCLKYYQEEVPDEAVAEVP